MQKTIEMLNEMWSNITKEQRVELLTTMGFNGSWAEANTVSEIGERGGGMIAREILKIFEEFQGI